VRHQALKPRPVGKSRSRPPQILVDYADVLKAEFTGSVLQRILAPLAPDYELLE